MITFSLLSHTTEVAESDVKPEEIPPKLLAKISSKAAQQSSAE